ncbi:MAG: MFS transporter [Candidatus Bathyarchaeota archaeon]|nr:MFS transporter [Candidatus Bathyarchaeota archaeon]
MSKRIDLRDRIQNRFELSPTFVIVITIFIDITGFGMIIPLLPFYAETFQAGSAALGVLVASFSLMQFIFSPILGRISDNVGRKPVLMISILTSAASFVLFAIANSFFILLLSRIVAGLATETAVAQAYIADITSKRERASGIGKVGAAHGAGFIIGPAIGGSLSVYGFSAPGFAAVFLTLLNLLFVLFFLPESLEQKGPILQRGTTNLNGGLLRKLLAFLSKPLIGAVLVIFFIVFLSFSAIPVIVPLLGVIFFGFGPVEMSYFFIYIGAIQIILQGVVIGRLTKKIGEGKLIAFGPLLMLLGIFLMPLIPNISMFLFSLTMIAFGSGMMRTVVPSFISKITPAREQGGTLGATNSVASIATVPGPLVGGFLFEFAGLAAPFFASAAMLIVAFGLGCRVFHACARVLKR